ncbi:cyclopropane-fatty-acyl-phospholipid synthase [Corynebacterium anserum]|uniref:Cyclopropane-fatty-acyl-phospholipid synthase n=1 Tax=Corynebacterium anserum TaxID=2684406 RepID=A0A7G7YR01_9CORY|nr:cyclopropane-fatty-acyl-phospholipid synthase [Corynebacterium anserum]
MVEQYIDEERWPNLVMPPRARFQGLRARDVTSRLEELLQAHDVSLETGSTPHMVVRDGQVIDRIVADGWLGLAEGYMAGEWSAEPLHEVLHVILSQPLEKTSKRLLGNFGHTHRHKFGQVRPGEIPEGLVELYAGATRATGAALFSASSRTSSAEEVTVHPSANSKTTETWPVDITFFGETEHVDRRDLDDAQKRRIEAMLDEAEVRPGDRVLELPSSGGQLAVQAALRGASVDVLTSDEDHADAVEARVRAAGVAGAVRVELIDGPIPSPRQWSGEYEAVFSVESMETLGVGGLKHYLRAVDRMLSRDGIAVIQSCVATEKMRETSREALDVMRAYVWPALDYPTIQQVLDTTARHTDMRVVAENHIGTHLAATIPLWRANFVARERQAAAAGFDVVFRRLWEYQLALHQALVHHGELDCVQFVFQPRYH